MPDLRQVLFSRATANQRAAVALVMGLPPYQVALWPDGWEIERDGTVTIRDTHAMAEARRWYRLAERNHAGDDGRRVMDLHGIFVPRAVVDMAPRRFQSERVASVALQLVAGDWIKQRRRQLLDAPESALRDRALAWSGSRYEPGLEPDLLATLVLGLLRTCAGERLIPDARYQVTVREDGAYGIAGCRCRVEVGLESYARARVEDVLRSALVPWNRAVVRDGVPAQLIVLEVSARQSDRMRRG